MLTDHSLPLPSPHVDACPTGDRLHWAPGIARPAAVQWVTSSHIQQSAVKQSLIWPGSIVAVKSCASTGSGCTGAFPVKHLPNALSQCAPQLARTVCGCPMAALWQRSRASSASQGPLCRGTDCSRRTRWGLDSTVQTFLCVCAFPFCLLWEVVVEYAWARLLVQAHSKDVMEHKHRMATRRPSTSCRSFVATSTSMVRVPYHPAA